MVSFLVSALLVFANAGGAPAMMHTCNHQQTRCTIRALGTPGHPTPPRTWHVRVYRHGRQITVSDGHRSITLTNLGAFMEAPHA